MDNRLSKLTATSAGVVLAIVLVSLMGCQRPDPVEPFGEDNYFFATGGLRLHYVDEGQGEPVLLLHDAGTWSYSWRDLLPKLTERYRVLALDLPGSGFSDKPVAGGEALKLDRLADDVAGLLHTAGVSSAAIIGHGWGGNVALVLAARQGERARGLVISGAWALAGRMETPLMMRVKEWPVAGWLACRWPPSWLLRKHFAPLFGAESGVPTAAWLEQVGLPLAGGKWCSVFFREVYSPFDQKLVGEVGNVSTKVLMLWGSEDRLAPVAAAKALEAALPDARLQIFEGAGHMLHEERPAAFNEAVLTFLDSVLTVPPKRPKRVASTARPVLPSEEIVREVDTQCPCPDGEMRGRRGARTRYRRCVRLVTNNLRAQGVITAREQAALLRRATRSTCGRGGFIRCCRRSRCRVAPPRRCERMRGRNLGPGSCYPNPCAAEAPG